MALLTFQHVNNMARQLGVRIVKKAANDRNLKTLAKYIVANKMCDKFIDGSGQCNPCANLSSAGSCRFSVSQVSEAPGTFS